MDKKALSEKKYIWYGGIAFPTLHVGPAKVHISLQIYIRTGWSVSSQGREDASDTWLP